MKQQKPSTPSEGMLTHIVKQPFVTATGIAAFVHSTWALGTLFAGQAPTWEDPVAFLTWILPAGLIAFAMDVGQIFTAAEIRAGQRGLTKYLTFGVFAVATYYLQFLYMAHHMPALVLGTGIRSDLVHVVTVLRDLAIFFVPMLLPLATLLYTFSQDSDHHARQRESLDRPEKALQARSADQPETLLQAGSADQPESLEKVPNPTSHRNDRKNGQNAHVLERG